MKKIQKICPEKIEELINSTNNEKHRFILALLYKLRLSTGMIINLKIKDSKAGYWLLYKWRQNEKPVLFSYSLICCG